jgi:predicted dienelactone hydrolase
VRSFAIGALLLALAVFSSVAHAVGFQRGFAPDPDGDPIEIGIWYPSDAATVPLRLGPTTLNVAPAGRLTGQAMPLIVISHGSGGSYLGHHDTAMALAQAGFVVVALTHPGDNYADHRLEAAIMQRPRHINRVIDYMLQTWPGHDNIDAARVGIFGFSAGGFTALVAIGGTPDLTKIGPHCQRFPGEFVCMLLAKHPEARAVPSGAGAPDGTQDSRIKAAVVAAPAIGFTFSPNGLTGVTVPVQLWRAEDDTVLPNPWYAEAVRQSLPRPPQYQVVPGAGHFDFLAPCGDQLTALAPVICTSTPPFDRAAFHAMFNRSVVDFFSTTLAR